MNYFFRAEKMTVGYHNKPLIENVEFALKKGEILTLDRAERSRKIHDPEEPDRTA